MGNVVYVGTSTREIKELHTNFIVEEGQSPGTGNTSTRIKLDSNASSVDGYYDPAIVNITGGTGIGQSRIGMEYDGTNKYFYVNRDWKVTPDSTSTYTIQFYPGNGHVNEGLAQAGASNTITLNALASAVNNAYTGQRIHIVAGTGADQAKTIFAYNGTSKVATVDSAWTTQPDNTSIYKILPGEGYLQAVPAADSADNTLMRDVIGNKTDTTSGDSIYSLSYHTDKEVTEIEHHLHGREKWFGAAASPSGETHVADRVGGATTAFTLTAGNNDFGNWVQVIGSSDTPVETGKDFFDPHRYMVTTTSSTNPFIIQLAAGESADLADKITAEEFTELMYISATNNNDSGIEDVMSLRIPDGTKVWARTACIGSSGSTISFYFGIHEYDAYDE